MKRKIDLFDLASQELSIRERKSISGGDEVSTCTCQCTSTCGPTYPTYTYSQNGTSNATSVGQSSMAIDAGIIYLVKELFL